MSYISCPNCDSTHLVIHDDGTYVHSGTSDELPGWHLDAECLNEVCEMEFRVHAANALVDGSNKIEISTIVEYR